MRFIAISNGVDSNDQSSGGFVPFINIMSEWYVRDCSRKQKAQWRDFLINERKFDIRLSDKDFKLLEQNARRCRLTKSAYIRKILHGCVPREAPPADYFGMMKKLETIEDELDTLSQIAAATGLVDAELLRRELRELRKIIEKMEQVVSEMK